MAASEALTFSYSDFVYLYYISYKLRVEAIHKQILLSLHNTFSKDTQISHISNSGEFICNSKFLQQISESNTA